MLQTYIAIFFTYSQKIICPVI